MQGAFLILLGLPGLTRVYSLLSDTQVRPSRREWGWFSCLEFVATAVALCAGFSLLVAYQNVGVCRFDMTEAECEARGVYHLAKWKGTACALLFAVAYVSRSNIVWGVNNPSARVRRVLTYIWPRGIHLLLTITAWIQCCCLLASRKRSKQLQVKQGI